jgi:hypothetical protein
MAVIWIDSGRFAGGYDPDAQAYITAVEAADSQALEVGVKDAINAFVVGCKADGIWDAIKASCILAGARTLAGALVPLVGTAPTNYNFGAGDYNRETGLAGDGSTKYLDSNRSVGADNQNSHHLGLYITTATTGTNNYIGKGSSVLNAYLHIGGATNGTTTYFRSKSSAVDAVSVTNPAAPFFAGLNRSSSGAFNVRVGSNISSLNAASKSLTSGNIEVFRDPGNAGFVDARLAFYSIGESLDLALLDARVTALINAIAAAIP